MEEARKSVVPQQHLSEDVYNAEIWILYVSKEQVSMSKS